MCSHGRKFQRTRLKRAVSATTFRHGKTDRGVSIPIAIVAYRRTSQQAWHSQNPVHWRQARRVPMSEEYCCEKMKRAHEYGTDNERYGSLMRAGKLNTVTGLREIDYCPWCGEVQTEGECGLCGGTGALPLRKGGYQHNWQCPKCCGSGEKDR